MLIVKKPESDGGWTFTFKMTGDEFASLDKDEFAILFSPTKSGAAHYPVSALLAVLFGFAKRTELKILEEEVANEGAV